MVNKDGEELNLPVRDVHVDDWQKWPRLPRQCRMAKVAPDGKITFKDRYRPGKHPWASPEPRWYKKRWRGEEYGVLIKGTFKGKPLVGVLYELNMLGLPNFFRGFDSSERPWIVAP